MTTIRIVPGEVRESGVLAVTASDDVQAQASHVLGLPMPPMPAGMAAAHEAAIAAAVSRIRNAAQMIGEAGAELQMRAAAAEAADAPSAITGVGGAAGAPATPPVAVVLPGGVSVVPVLSSAPTGGGVQATVATGLKVTMPELVRDASGVLTSRDAADSGKADRLRREPIKPLEERGGAPAAAVQQAVAGGGAGAGGGGAAALPGGAVLGGDAVDPTAVPVGEHRAETQDRGLPVPVDMPTDADAARQEWACWMAGSAAKAGVPPTLPVMLALAQSGLRNAPAGGDSVGFFGIDPAGAYAPAGHGHARDVQPDASWWEAHPEAQLDDLLSRLRGTAGGTREVELDDAEGLGRWAADALPGFDPAALSDTQEAASILVESCKHAAGDGGAGGSNALEVAQSQLGVREVGVNAGPEVNRYLATAGVASGNPWCASFVQWSLAQSGHEMPGTGWAAVVNWVQAAQAGEHGLQLVSAAEARPGDIVAYDWGGDGNFGADGHIGFLESRIDDGRFVAVEGNAEDAVTRMQRSLGQGDVVFIRVAGDG